MAGGRQWKLDLQYAKAMDNHPFGIAMYRPPKLSILRPGMVGYFDVYGSWNIIVDLQNEEDLARNGLTPVEEVVKAPTDIGIQWGPKLSKTTKSTKIDLSAEIPPVPGIPVTASAVYSYSVDRDVGAILLTTRPVVHDRFYHTGPFKDWMKKNAPVILKRWPDEVKENGLWVVTSTYSTSRCAINMWQNKGRKFKVGFSVDIASMGGAGTSVEWYRSSTEEGWGEYSTEDDDRPVIFFGGLKFNYTHMFRKKSLTPEDAGSRFRGDWEVQAEDPELDIIASVPDPEDDEKEFEVDCEEHLGGSER